MTLAQAGSLDPEGPVAESIAGLWWLMLALGVAVFVLFAVLLAVAAYRRHDPDRDHSAEAGRKLTRWWIVAGGVAMPLVVISIVYAANLVVMRDTPDEAPPDALTVEIVGHQFWYEIHYPDAGIITANELHIPVGRPIAFELRSSDVIHSFWVPALGGKVDLLPDHPTSLVLEASEPGVHRSKCAEFCGLQHTRMGLLVVAEPQEDFDNWIAQQQPPAAEPEAAEARRGQEVFFEASCAECHAIDGTRATGRDGPDLTHLASRETLGALTLPNTREDLAAWIVSTQEIKHGAEMPATSLSDEDLDALLTYLGTLE